MKPSRQKQDTIVPSDKPHSSNPNGSDDRLYRPMLLRFRCIGGYSLSDPEHSHSNNHNNNSNTNTSDKVRWLQKRCLGLHTRLEPLGEYPAMTAEDALENFTYAVSHDRFQTANGFGGLHQHHQHHPATAGRTRSLHTRGTDDNDDDGDDALVGNLPILVDPKLVEVQRHLDDEGDDDEEHRTPPHPSFRRGGIGGTGTTGTLTHHSRFYGSTHIGVLLLRPHNPLLPTSTEQRTPTHTHPHPPLSLHSTFPPGSVQQYGENSVSPQTLSESVLYAVSPQNTFGLSIRELNRDDPTHQTTSGGTYTTLRVGVVEVSLASRHEGVYIDDEVEDDTHTQEHETGRVASSVQRARGDEKLRAGTQSQSTQPPKDLTEVAEEYYDRVVGMAGKLTKSMALNAAFLKDELTDDFPNRFGKGAEKVVQGLGKQLGRMEKFGRDLYSFLSEGEGSSGGGGGHGR